MKVGGRIVESPERRRVIFGPDSLLGGGGAHIVGQVVGVEGGRVAGDAFQRRVLKDESSTAFGRSERFKKAVNSLLLEEWQPGYRCVSNKTTLFCASGRNKVSNDREEAFDATHAM